MIRLRLLQAAPLLLLLQIASVEGLLNLTGCDSTKACWVGQECERERDPIRITQFLYLAENQEHFDKIDKSKECSKYLIVEPGTDHFIFEIMHDKFKASDEIILSFQRSMVDPNFQSLFTCKDHAANTPSNQFRVENEPIAERDHAFCRFKVTSKTMRITDRGFYSTFIDTYHSKDVQIEHGSIFIKVDNYNEVIFAGRVPCASSIFSLIGEKKQHFVKPLHDVISKIYVCPEYYTMSYKTDSMKEMTLKPLKYNILCKYGKVVAKDTLTDVDPVAVASAQCARRRNTLCTEFCTDNCTEQKIKHKPPEQGQLIFGCTTKFMILNGNKITKKDAMCSDESSPETPLWEVKGDFTPNPIKTVKCVDELDCNDITPFDDATCHNCKSVSKENGGIKCDSGYHMIMIDRISNAQHNVTITCNKLTGEWKLVCENANVCKDLKGTQKEMTKWKLGCEGPKEKEKEKEDDKPVAAASSSLLYVGISLGALLLILLFILLLYYICCRKGRKEPPRDESSKPPTPPTQPKTTESSNVEQAVEPPPPIAPASSEPEPSLFSGKRVQFINMSKEHLREIEPEDPYMEVSARDKTDSERSKPSQMSQVGGTTDAGTVTGRQTEKTNEMSRTIANADDSRSDVSNGRGNDNSQTGGGGNTPTIGDAAKKKERKGPRVAFRERVSYETDPTKTRDKSSVASMHTAPEQPWPAVDSTQPEVNSVEGKSKDDPSRLNADSARKAFGTRTTQNTKEANDHSSVAGNRSASRVTDISRTG